MMMFLTAYLVWRRRKNPGNVGKQRSRKAEKEGTGKGKEVEKRRSRESKKIKK